MTNMQRIKEIFIALLYFGAALLLFLFLGEGYRLLIYILSIVFLCSGIGKLYYFFTIGRFMVEGKGSLYRGIMMVDFGMVTGSLTNVPRIYVLAYLLVVYAFSAVVALLRAREMKREGASSWKYKAAEGVVNMILAVACILFATKLTTAVILYAIGLMYSAVTRFILAFRKTKFIYFQ